MQNKSIAILGCTGSIGTQALDVAERRGYYVSAVSCGRNIEKAEEIIRKFGCRLCAVNDKSAAALLRAAVKDTECTVIGGRDASAIVAMETDADTVLNSITGIAGLLPSVNALKSGKCLALANKESLVCAGRYVMELAGKNNREILPVDSEHCAVWQSLSAGRKEDVKRIILTASGGPFFGFTKDALASVTAEQALKHPTWNMGAKITVDSATLMNKGFEVIEAAWLFGVPASMIDVIVHRESIIHSMVEYKDNMIIAQLGVPDMRSCIQYALTQPSRCEGDSEPLDLAKLSKMTFYVPDNNTFPLLDFARKVYGMGGSYGAALNGANEEAVAAFLRGETTLPALFDAVMAATELAGTDLDDIDAVFDADMKARAAVKEHLGKRT